MDLSTYNNISTPTFMYGTAWKKDATTDLVLKALDSGFTAIDTANQLIHYDEARVGHALKQKFDQGLDRNSLFLQTKFTPVHSQDERTPYDRQAPVATQVEQSFQSSLEHLHTDYLDSYVLHGPYSRNGLTNSDKEVWSTMEKLYKEEKTRMIGISNVMPDQLEELVSSSSVKPMVVQNRCFAVNGWDKPVREICSRENIIYQGFSLLTANVGVLRHPFIKEIATRIDATIAQVIFAFSRQVGMQLLTGTTNEDHMKEDLGSQKLSLTESEVKQIESLAL